MNDRVVAPGPKTEAYLRAAEGERDSRIRRLAFLVLCMSLLNAIPVLVVSIGYLARRGAHPSVVLIAPVGTLVGGAVLAWGLRSRRQWAWFATLLAFGSLFGGSLVLAAGSLYHGVGATVFLAMGVGSASALPLTILWRDRGLYGSAGSDEEEEMISS